MNKSIKRDRILTILGNYEPFFLTKKIVKTLRDEWNDELIGFDYIKDASEIKIGNYIRYIDLNFKKMSRCYLVTNIIFIDKTVDKIVLHNLSLSPSRYYIFKSDFKNLKERELNEFIKNINKEYKLDEK
jgi:hypothetical protein